MKKKIIVFIILLFGFFTVFKDSNIKASSSSISAGIVDTGGANLNVRASASTSSNVITQIKDDSYLTIVSTNGNWYYVEYADSEFGYVHKNYVDLLSSKVRRINTSGANLNVRTGPSTGYSIKDQIAHNDYVVILSSSTYWSRVLFEGNKTGYVYNNYLNYVNSYTYPSKSLSVPSYKQYDSRWAYNTIGSSGQTFKKAGCLITSMAMTESYRTGTTITPVSFEAKSKFTSDGSLYWPSNYNFITSNSGYLTKIYNLLKQGKPVIIGTKNSSGGQHWVVVYGYNGSNTLSASNFLIRDPGNTKTTLQQHLNSYPTFYKIAYYN